MFVVVHGVLITDAGGSGSPRSCHHPQLESGALGGDLGEHPEHVGCY